MQWKYIDAEIYSLHRNSTKLKHRSHIQIKSSIFNAAFHQSWNIKVLLKNYYNFQIFIQNNNKNLNEILDFPKVETSIQTS